MIGRIAVFDKVSEDALGYRPTFKEQIGAELADITVFKTTASFELGDTLELQQDVYRHNGSSQHKRDFPAVREHGQDMTLTNITVKKYLRHLCTRQNRLILRI